ncbi:hypothetical protein [Pseudomonas gingeri]|uniref:hypothetical protein n=1 Tax=Pseudomonas gingeri TaxID=117681 RepID=UPI001C430586|nr:hypothetical protein [Pseudomonas gingeri]
MQSDLFESPKPAPVRDPNAELHRQLVRLGDMIGDGMADEPDGAWIKKEYREVCKSLGYVKARPRRNRGPAINAAVAKYLETARCECGGQLVQSRSGSKRVDCIACRKRYQLKAAKPPAGA